MAGWFPHQGRGIRAAGIQSAAAGGTTCQEEFRTTLVITFWAGSRTAAEGAPGSGAVRHPPWRAASAQQQQQKQQSALSPSPQSPEAASLVVHTALDADSAAATWPADFNIPVDSKGEPSHNEILARAAARGACNSSLGQCARSPQSQPVLSGLPRVSPVWVPVSRVSDPSEGSADVGSSPPALKRRRTVDDDGLQGYHLPRVSLPPFFPLPPLRFFLTGRSEIKHAYCLAEDTSD